MPIDFNQLREFIEAIAKTDISELAIKEGDFELTLQKTHPEIASATYTITPATPVATTSVETSKPVEVEVEQATVTVEETSAKKKAANLLEITSPMVGTFYRAPAPGEASFVEVGDSISTGQVVCIIEAMKLMNEIEAEISGKVVEILVDNGEPIEYGQPLILISPD